METDSTGAKPRRRRTPRNNWNKGWKTKRRMNLSKSWESVLLDWNYCFIENKSSLFAIPVVIDSNVLKCIKQSAILTNLSRYQVIKWFSGRPVDSVYQVLLDIPSITRYTEYYSVYRGMSKLGGYLLGIPSKLLIIIYPVKSSYG